MQGNTFPEDRNDVGGERGRSEFGLIDDDDDEEDVPGESQDHQRPGVLFKYRFSRDYQRVHAVLGQLIRIPTHTPWTRGGQSPAGLLGMEVHLRSICFRSASALNQAFTGDFTIVRMLAHSSKIVVFTASRRLRAFRDRCSFLVKLNFMNGLSASSFSTAETRLVGEFSFLYSSG